MGAAAVKLNSLYYDMLVGLSYGSADAMALRMWQVHNWKRRA